MIFNKPLLARLFCGILCLFVFTESNAKSNTYNIKELDYSVQKDAVLVKMDTIKNQILVSTCLKTKVNIQYYDVLSLSKIKEQNFPLNLPADENVSDFFITNFDKIRIVLKTYSTEKINIKIIEVDGPGLISKPITLLELDNHHLSLILSEINPKKSVDKQVHLTFSANKKFMAIINKQSLVCSIDGKGLEIHSYDQQLKLRNTFVEDGCAFKNLFLFSNGKIVLSKSVNKQVKLMVYSNHFFESNLDYTFPEITEKTEDENEIGNDTFDQQFQFYFDDSKSLLYAYIKGFVNNNYISHTGLFVYDVANKKPLLSTNNIHKTKQFLAYSISYRDNMAAYEYEYPLHLSMRYIKQNTDGTYDIIGDYKSYGSLPLADRFAGVAKSEATYLMHLSAVGALIETKILLHRQSIITYPDSIATRSAYLSSDQGIDFRIGQVYLYDDTGHYVIHNNDKKAFYSADRLYRFTYFGKDGVVAGVKFSSQQKSKEKVEGLKDYTLLPMLENLNLTPQKALVFAHKKKEIKLLAISVSK